MAASLGGGGCSDNAMRGSGTSTKMVRVGVDVGGTNTDLVLIDERQNRITLHKVPTTADDPSYGTLNALVEACTEAGVSPGNIDYFMHGTTIATNVALEHKGARCGLIT